MGADQYVEDLSGCGPVEWDQSGCGLVEWDQSGCVPVEWDRSGCGPVEWDRSECGPVQRGSRWVLTSTWRIQVGVVQLSGIKVGVLQ